MYLCEYGWTKISGVHLHYMRNGSSQINNTRKMFLMLPGNPGSMYFYDKFAHNLHKNTGIPVWGVSHTGHVSVSERSHDKNDINHPSSKKCGLTYQIEHKIEFLKQKVLPDVDEIYLIGHSVGCYIALEILNELSEVKLKKAILLFPTVEHIGSSENGKRAIALSKFQSFVWYIGTFVNILPLFVRKWIAKLVVKTNDPTIHDTVLRDIVNDPLVMDSCTYMGKQEMMMILDRKDEIIQKYSDNLIFYFGSNDLWCPREYYHNTVSMHKNVCIKLCKNEYKHAFVLEHSVEVANMIAGWFHKDFEIDNN